MGLFNRGTSIVNKILGRRPYYGYIPSEKRRNGIMSGQPPDLVKGKMVSELAKLKG